MVENMKELVEEMHEHFIATDMLGPDSSASEAEVLTRQMMEPFLHHWTNDNYTLNQAEGEMVIAFSNVQARLPFLSSQQDIINNDTSDWGVEDIVQWLPGYIALSPFELDPGQLMLHCSRHLDGKTFGWDANHSSDALFSYIELWSPGLDQEQFREVLKMVIGETPTYPEHFSETSLYFDKIITNAPEGMNLDDFVQGILEHGSILPAYSFIPGHELHEALERQYVIQSQPELFGITQEDGVVPVRYVEDVVRLCPNTYNEFSQILLSDKRTNEFTALYVKGMPVVALKMNKNGLKTVLGLRNIQDSQGRLTVAIGGVYGTTSSIVKQAEEAYEEQGRPAKLHLEELPLKPLAYLKQVAPAGAVDHANIHEACKHIESL
ncbi:hypothetical protein ACFL1B_04760 [Nanoarchaeota archaeon]